MFLLKFINKLFNRYVYNHTLKPEHYVHVDKPLTLQEYRQIQYNRWCKRYAIYNGSYLLKDSNTLLRKGWVESTHQLDNSGDKEFTRKSSKQRVRFEHAKNDQIDHYHWFNPNPTIRNKKYKTEYLDRYGMPCTKKDDCHHLAPLDADCPKNASKKYIRSRKEI